VVCSYKHTQEGSLRRFFEMDFHRSLLCCNNRWKGCLRVFREIGWVIGSPALVEGESGGSAPIYIRHMVPATPTDGAGLI